jgi:hypothetical protein
MTVIPDSQHFPYDSKFVRHALSKRANLVFLPDFRGKQGSAVIGSRRPSPSSF